MNKVFIPCFLLIIATGLHAQQNPVFIKQVTEVLRQPVLKEAAKLLTVKPETVTSSRATRSAGAKHDFFSEGDYWWPDPKHADSPYIQKDGLSNPANFTAHRLAMIKFSQVVGSMASAYLLTGEEKYAKHALRHADAWFSDTATMMAPHLLYAQAIFGRATGRGIGIIDAIHLVEVVKGLQAIEKKWDRHDKKSFIAYRQWFASYLEWVTTHKYGRDEMKAANNHGTCWVMQVAVFAGFTGNETLQELCRERFKTVLLPQQMAADGSFPLELKRTKPYGYSLFNLDAMATICQELSTPTDDLWSFATTDGRSMKLAIDFMYPFIKNKVAWPFKSDVMYWEEWPVAQPFLVFGGLRFRDAEWIQTWSSLEHSPAVDEVIRNLPVRNPLLWF